MRKAKPVAKAETGRMPCRGVECPAARHPWAPGGRLTRGAVRLAFLALTALHGYPSLAQPVIPVPFVRDAPLMDGDARDWAVIKNLDRGIVFYDGDGNRGERGEPGTTVCGKVDGEADCRVELWLAHDGRYLYILAEVADDDHEPFDLFNRQYPAFKEDTLQLYVDSVNARRHGIRGEPIGRQPGYEQFGVSTDGNIWGENCDFNTSGRNREPAPTGSAPDGYHWTVACTVHKSEAGYRYIFEERILLNGRTGANMSPLVPGESYGFNAEFCDADRGVPLEGFIWWSSHSGIDAWNHQDLWGTMVLDPLP